MRTKRKISITIDSELLRAFDNASKTYSMTRSHMAQEAFALWLKKKTEQLMAKGYSKTAEEDKEFAHAVVYVYYVNIRLTHRRKQPCKQHRQT